MAVIPDRMRELIPVMVLSELERLPTEHQAAWLEEFERRRKGMLAAYFAWCFTLQYAYLGRWGMQLLYWCTGLGLLFWLIVDLFRLPGLVRDYNRDVAVAVMRDLKAVSQ